MTETWLTSRLAVLPGAPERLVHRGRYLTTTFLLEVGDEQCLIDIEHGRVAGVRGGPMVMPSWTFAVRADRSEWEKYWSPLPPPGTHDLMALLKRGKLRFEGDLAPLMGNLLYIKELLALPRGGREEGAPA